MELPQLIERVFSLAVSSAAAAAAAAVVSKAMISVYRRSN